MLPIDRCGSNERIQVGLVSSRFWLTGAQVRPKLMVSKPSSPLPLRAPRSAPRNSVVLPLRAAPLWVAS